MNLLCELLQFVYPVFVRGCKGKDFFDISKIFEEIFKKVFSNLRSDVFP